MDPAVLEKKIKSLRKRLTLDFQPLRDTLAKGLEVYVDVSLFSMIIIMTGLSNNRKLVLNEILEIISRKLQFT